MVGIHGLDRRHNGDGRHNGDWSCRHNFVLFPDQIVPSLLHAPEFLVLAARIAFDQWLDITPVCLEDPRPPANSNCMERQHGSRIMHMDRTGSTDSVRNRFQSTHLFFDFPTPSLHFSFRLHLQTPDFFLPLLLHCPPLLFC